MQSRRYIHCNQQLQSNSRPCDNVRLQFAHVRRDQTCDWIWWALSIQPKIPENSGWYIKWNGSFRFGPTGIFGTIFEGGPLWPVKSFRSVGPKCPFLFLKIVVPSPALLYPAYKNNNQTRGDLGRVCTTGMYRPIKHVEFPKFQSGIFAESKAPDDRANHIAKTLRLSICTIITVRVVESGHRMKIIKSQRSLKTK